MIFAPTAGPYGLQTHTTTARMINRNGSALAVGDVVQTSWEHTGASTFFTTTPSTDATLRTSPLACVVKIDAVEQDNVVAPCFIGVVTDIGNYGGADGTEVSVSFGTILSVNVKAIGGAVAYGAALGAGDSTLSPSAVGLLIPNAQSTDPDVIVAYALGPVDSGATALCPVIFLPQPIAI
jgi:hypothetical protein